MATFRGHSLSLYAVTMGANYAITGFSILGSEKVISFIRGGKSDPMSYAMGGCVGGGTLGGFFRGPRNVIPGAIVFGSMSGLGRLGFEMIDHWRRQNYAQAADE
eukprot:CAMPEP_0185754738 /NCGR_PEP_ID=MMETSP1174-20130828/13340_1 /TAXON_ID=35687 /ORGANISM="Dictyocha speculum, Strain CCMP1381" /LENGTH=103 /DNA_ID=CAMNT_0028433067 /DNA_START=132 /DNA_END=443 /DNA_ORIENTATION=-